MRMWVSTLFIAEKKLGQNETNVIAKIAVNQAHHCCSQRGRDRRFCVMGYFPRQVECYRVRVLPRILRGRIPSPGSIYIKKKAACNRLSLNMNRPNPTLRQLSTSGAAASVGHCHRGAALGAETLGGAALCACNFDDAKRVDQREVITRFRLPISSENLDFVTGNMHERIGEFL